MIKSKCRPQRIARPFSLEEDQKLLSLVSQHGDQDFELIASKMEGRTIKEVRYHYFKELYSNYPVLENNRMDIVVTEDSNSGCQFFSGFRRS